MIHRRLFVSLLLAALFPGSCGTVYRYQNYPSGEPTVDEKNRQRWEKMYRSFPETFGRGHYRR